MPSALADEVDRCAADFLEKLDEFEAYFRDRDDETKTVVIRFLLSTARFLTVAQQVISDQASRNGRKAP